MEVVSRPHSEIIQEVQRLHASNMPMNITAVKRHSPELIQDVYRRKFFWGWRRVLEHAGLTYQDIRIELLDSCVCRLCGHQAPLLTAHIRNVHQMPVKKYMIPFRKRLPDTEVMCEKMRAAKMGKCEVLPHWEPVWSAEYILDRIWMFYKMDFPLNHDAMSKVDRPLTNAALTYYGSWDAPLRMLRLSPEKIRIHQPRKALTKWKVKKRLRSRIDEGRPMNLMGIKTEDAQLYRAAVKFFGSLRDALKAVGVDPDQVQIRPARHSDQDKDRVLSEIRRIAALHGEKRVREVAGLQREFRKIVRRMGGWKKLAAMAQVPLIKLSSQWYTDEEEVLAALADRARKNKSLTPRAILDEDRELHYAIRKFFNTFENVKRNLHLEMDEDSEGRKTVSTSPSRLESLVPSF